MMHYYGWRMMQPGGSFGAFGWVLGLIFFMLLMAGLVALVKWYSKDDNDENSGKGVLNKPLEILKERYAKGEISSREFEKIKKEIV